MLKTMGEDPPDKTIKIQEHSCIMEKKKCVHDCTTCTGAELYAEVQV